MIRVRRARLGDADAAIEVVRQSITHLCVEDHRNDEATLTTWLVNKTPENFRQWISSADIACVVAESPDRLLGVGIVHRRGEILMFYLAPGTQRQGIGRSIHAALLDEAARWGLTSLHLDSTDRARPFYEALGYRSTGPAAMRFGVLHSFPYAAAVPHPKRFEQDDPVSDRS